MKSKHLFILAVLIIFSIPNATAQYQPSKGTLGLGASLQSGQYDVNVPIWLGEKTVLAPAILFNMAQDVGTDIGFSLTPRFYLSTNKIAPYLSARAGMIANSPAEENEASNETRIDWIGGIGFGGEYFISPQFSIGVEAQGNVTNSDEGSYRFGNPGKTNFNLATAVSVRVYFAKED